ncbi:hypothetical protein GJ744_007336 [Endocarpon pusillum]|uniref:Uncharacterized protein n=1 Tax=Endocarpon pusillum TaxID=364733 RepID=A0A8H7ARI3_9EURO|nr:hypothetical protein GJ744_007336 [Endocarpon pusillum]
MLWGGRFTEGFDPLMVACNESICFDRAILRTTHPWFNCVCACQAEDWHPDG